MPISKFKATCLATLEPSGERDGLFG